MDLMEQHLAAMRERFAGKTAIELEVLVEERQAQAADNNLSNRVREIALEEVKLFNTMRSELSPPPPTVDETIRYYREMGRDDIADNLAFSRDKQAARDKVAELESKLEGAADWQRGAIEADLEKAQAAVDAMGDVLPSHQRDAQVAALKSEANDIQAQADQVAGSIEPRLLDQLNQSAESKRNEARRIEQGLSPEDNAA